MCLRLTVLLMLIVGGLQVYGTCCCSEVVEARSNDKKSYLWWFRNPACGDSTESNRIEKDWIGVRPGLVWGNGGGRVVGSSVCEAPLDD